MKVYMDESNLNYFEALASPTRLEIIQLLAERDRNIKELAGILDISSSIVTKHIYKLESARLITTKNISKNGSRHKQCTLVRMPVEVHPPEPAQALAEPDPFFQTALPIGLYTGLETQPPCGIANESKVIGYADYPAHLFTTERTTAQLLWISDGYVEYAAPNYATGRYAATALDISGEFGPQLEQNPEPSQIEVSLNGTPVCSFFAFATPGPGHWPFHQRGAPIRIRVDGDGVTVNGEQKKGASLSDLDLSCASWTLRFTVAGNQGGGLSLYGKKVGSQQQNLLFRTYYGIVLD